MKHKALKHLNVIAFFLLLAMHAFSQQEAGKWFFGNHCGLDFSVNPPAVIPSPSFNSAEGGAAISDAAGNLLFYTDANTVWNQAHAVMANGSGLLGNQSSMQSAIIVKQPGSSNIYFIFTQGANAGGLRYSTVNMSLAAGMGSVTAKNTLLYSPGGENLCAARHCNGTDVWVLSHEPGTAVFRSYLVTAAGVSAVPVLSAVPSAIPGFNYALGVLKVSPTGKKLAMNRFADNAIELFDFNSSTGAVANPFVLKSAFTAPYGCEFSPDGSRFYAGRIFGDQLMQWDLCQPNQAAVAASSVVLSTGNTTDPVGSLQLAPNGRIYVSFGNEQALSVINNPNAAGAACSFSFAAQPVGSGTTSLGLPNFISGYFKEPAAIAFTQSCSVATFTAPGPACEAVTTYTAFAWAFNDPASGAQNTATLPVVSHAFSAIGTYTVALTMYSECGTETVHKVIHVSSLSPTVTVSGSLAICAGRSATLQAGGAHSYSWSAGPATASLVVSPAVATAYTVTGSYTNGCNASARVVTVNVLPLPVLNTAGAQAVCSGQSTTLNASGAVSYSWSTGVIAGSIAVTPAADMVYSLSGTGANGCVNTVTLQITVKPLPVLSPGNFTMCAGETTVLSANAIPATGPGFLWQPGGETTATLAVAPVSSRHYTVSATLNGCMATVVHTVTVNVPAIAHVDFSYQSPVCISGSEVAPAPAAGFNWGGSFIASSGIKVNAASGIIDVAASSPGRYVVTYVLPAANCIAAATHTAWMAIEEAPVLNVSPDVKINAGASATLSVKSSVATAWANEPGINCTVCTNPVVTPAESTRYCVLAENAACKSKACVYVEVSCEGGDLSVPNAFSPNGDGYNDAYCLQGWNICIDKFSVMIFDRWGEKVFESQDPNFCWDGSHRGQVLASDIVIYMITATFNNGNAITRKGNITLLH